MSAKPHQGNEMYFDTFLYFGVITLFISFKQINLQSIGSVC